MMESENEWITCREGVQLYRIKEIPFRPPPPSKTVFSKIFDWQVRQLFLALVRKRNEI